MVANILYKTFTFHYYISVGNKKRKIMRTIKLTNAQINRISSLLWDEYVSLGDENDDSMNGAQNFTLDILKALGEKVEDEYYK